MISNDLQPEQDPVFQLKGSLFTLTVLVLLKIAPTAFAEQLSQLVKQTPRFFHYMPVVLDLQKLKTCVEPINFDELISQVRSLNIIVVGVRGGTPEQHKAAQTVGLAIFPNAKKLDAANAAAKTAKTSASAAKPAPAVQTSTTKFITQPIRSGQQVYARNADLVVLSKVSHGAELLADGNIHVYGTLRGRALAGVTGDQNARIFCQNLEADLVAIAGHYWVSEDLHNSPIKQNVHLYLKDDRLQAKTF